MGRTLGSTADEALDRRDENRGLWSEKMILFALTQAEVLTLPFKHEVHSEDITVSAYLPSGQNAQDCAFCSVENFPFGQLSQASPTRYIPGRHTLQTEG